MPSTLSTLADVQLKRAAAFPAKVADNPLRALLLDSVQRRNAALDAVFYDVGVVTEAETQALAFWLAREGAILRVPPGGEALKVCLTKEEFFANGGADCGALAVAGVGSSALGAAAFARNVADALGEPVAAVVSGYGLADVMTEAMGGFFWFGGLNSIRHAFEGLDEVTKRLTHSEQPRRPDADWLQISRDTATVIALLEDERFTADLLIGHSKGNLVVSEALYAIEALGASIVRDRARDRRIITVSAKIGMPPPYRKVIDVMGQWDTFGALNSRPDIPADFIVPGAWHSTNPDFPLGMGIKVGQMLRTVLPLFDGLEPPPDPPLPLLVHAHPIAVRGANDSRTLTLQARFVLSAALVSTAGLSAADPLRTDHGEARLHQDPPELHGGHRLLLRHEEERPHQDREDGHQEV